MDPDQIVDFNLSGQFNQWRFIDRWVYSNAKSQNIRSDRVAKFDRAHSYSHRGITLCTLTKCFPLGLSRMRLSQSVGQRRTYSFCQDRYKPFAVYKELSFLLIFQRAPFRLDAPLAESHRFSPNTQITSFQQRP